MVIFFHGLNSSSKTNKFTAISEPNKVCLSVDHNDPKTNFETFDYLVRECLNNYDDVILVGHSFGAFWARLFAKKYNLRALLINPSLWPEKLIGKLSSKAIDYIASLDNQHSDLIKGHIIMLIELGDELIDFQTHLDELKSESLVVTWDDGHHRFSRLDEIDKYIEILRNSLT
jgi:predicted esterase YcpF (UPF0227 family)